MQSHNVLSTRMAMAWDVNALGTHFCCLAILHATRQFDVLCVSEVVAGPAPPPPLSPSALSCIRCEVNDVMVQMGKEHSDG